MKNRNPHKKNLRLDWHFGPLIILAAAILLLLTILIFLVALPQVKSRWIIGEARLVNGTETWQKWTNVKASILIKFYLFNVTNVDAVIRNGTKFELQEIGPYVWEENRTKEIISVDEEKDTVTYREIFQFYFRPDLSVGSQTDRVNVVNIPFFTVALSAYNKMHYFFADQLIDHLVDVENETMVLEGVKIHELIFDGVALKSFYGDLAVFSTSKSSELIDGKFAFYNKRNGTPSLKYTIYRGVQNYENFGKIVTYNLKPYVSQWSHQSLSSKNDQYHCNQINGSDGSIIPPFVEKDRHVYIFSPEICRSFYMSFDKEVTFQGINGYRFITAKELISGGERNTLDSCFCPHVGLGLENDCPPGIIRISRCKADTPVALSYPHFLDAPDIIRNGVGGMLPNQAKHESILEIEPATGVLLRTAKRLQVNLEYQRLPGISIFDHVNARTYVPVFWAEELSVMDEATKRELRFWLVDIAEIFHYIFWSLFSMSCMLLLMGIGVTLRHAKLKQGENQNMLGDFDRFG